MALATTTNRNYPIVDDAPTSYLDTIIIPALADLANLIDVDVQTLITGKIATTALDTDGTLAANDDAKIASQKATKTYANSVGAAAIAASQPLAARLTAIVATGIAASMFATNVLDTDATLSANDNARIASQSAVKSYVDNAITGVFWKPAADVATTGNITLSGEQTIDGVLTSASRVLVKAQTTASQNGLYLSGAGAWTRVAEADTGFEIWGATVMVKRGTVGANTQWTNTNTAQPTLGSTSITFAQISGAGTYSATGGVILTGNQFSADMGTSGHKLPWLDGANTWSAQQTISTANLGLLLSHANNPYWQVTNTTGSVQLFGQALSTGARFGTLTNHNLDILINATAVAQFNATSLDLTGTLKSTNATAISFERTSHDVWRILQGTPSSTRGIGLYNNTDAVYGWFVSDTENVGIGTTDPNIKLHVVGGFRSAGARSFFVANGEPYAVGLAYDAASNTAYIGASSGSTPNVLISNQAGSTIATFLNSRAVRFDGYGAGTLVTDSAGNITASSDERLKVMGRRFTRGLADMLKMDDPRFYRWRKLAGMDGGTYVGFGAQGARKGIPETVGKDPRGYLTLMDRPMIATHHNAIIDLHKRNVALERRLAKLERKAA